MTVAGDGPKLDGIVFDAPSATKVVVAVVDRGRGPVFRTVHPRTLSERPAEGADDRALRLLIRRTPPPARGAASRRQRRRPGPLGPHARGDAPHHRQVARRPMTSPPDARRSRPASTSTARHPARRGPATPRRWRRSREVDLDALSRAVAEQLDERGVSFGADPFVVDPVPRLIAGAEWDALTDGLAQRARALNCFLRDAYGERRIVAAGVVDERDDRAGRGLRARRDGPAARARRAGGDHRLRRRARPRRRVPRARGQPAHALRLHLRARRARGARRRPCLRASRPPRPLDGGDDGAAAAPRSAPPRRRAATDPSIVVLGDGAHSSARYEHAQAAGATRRSPRDAGRPRARRRGGCACGCPAVRRSPWTSSTAARTTTASAATTPS